MKRSAIVWIGLLLAFLGFAGAAEANTACFDWECNPDTHFCTFNASCSTITQGSVWRYRWDFGDGSSIVLTSGTTTSHTYGQVPNPDVSLTLLMFSGPEDEELCEIRVWEQVGPFIGTSGRCPEV
jgi:hypothetical protein